MQTYFDHNASSPMHPEVLETISSCLRQPIGNASSLHSTGRMARSAIETARGQIAELVNGSVESVIFTSGGSEANNLMLKGFVDPDDSRPVVSTEIEHPSILQPLVQLEKSGIRVTHLKVNTEGQVDLDLAQSVLKDNNPQMLSVILANNETGVIQPVKELGELVDPKTCLVHTDATQAVGKIPVDMVQLGVGALTLSGHKMQGPQGIGALIVNKNPGNILISGGEQEKNRRAGTENVAMIAGLGKAAQLAALEMQQKRHHLTQLREVLETRLAAIPGVVIFGRELERLPNTTYFSLPYYHGETLLMELDRAGFALSSGSACHSEVTSPSHVLKAMGIDDNLALNAVRVSFGSNNTLQEVEALVSKLRELINRLPAVIRQVAV